VVDVHFKMIVEGTHRFAVIQQGLDLLRDLLAVEPIIILNAAFCEHHVGHCPASEELAIECGRV
jgi:hypothetical protein